MNKEEINKIINICEKNGIKYDVNKLDFIEKDTKSYVNLKAYALLVVKENGVLILDGFYSSDKINSYLQKALSDKDRKIIYEGNKEMTGYILLDNENNFKRYTEFYELNKKVDSKKQKLEETQPNTNVKQEKKYILFKYLKEQKYLTDIINIKGQRTMYLDAKEKKMYDIIIDLAKSNQYISPSYFEKYINVFGFQWNYQKTECCIPVDIKIFEEYYLPFTSVFTRYNYKRRLQFLKTLYNFYQTPCPKNTKEEELLKEEIRTILEIRVSLFIHLREKYNQYPRKNK